MKLAIAAAAFLALPLASVSTASACAMRKRPPKMIVARNDLPRAIKAEKAGKLRTAIRLYERVMNGGATTADKVQGALAASRLHEKSGNTLKAVARARKAVSMDGKHAAARLRLGSLLVEAEPAVARLHLERASILDVADKAGLNLAQARLHLAQGQAVAAARFLDKAEAAGADAEAVKALRDALAKGAAPGADGPQVASKS